MRLKIAFVGQRYVGKSSLSLRVISLPLRTVYEPTQSNHVISGKVSDSDIQLQIVDCSASCATNNDLFYGVDIFFFVFDVSSQESFEYIDNILPEYRKQFPKVLKFYIVGNKIDLDLQRVVTYDQAEDFAIRNDLTYIEVSAAEWNSNYLQNFVKAFNIFLDPNSYVDAEDLHNYPNQIITLDDYDFTNKASLGKGAFGDVLMAYDKKTGEKVAIKTVNDDEMEATSIKLYKREVCAMIRCHDMFVVKLLGFSMITPFAIVMELVPNGNLFDHLHRGPVPIWLDGTRKTIIAMGIAHGMSALHKNGIIHRDLKSSNILLDQDYFPKICDFGIARFANQMISHNVPIGTPHWMAPEMFMISQYDHKIDVYAYAMILYEILTYNVPFKSVAPVDLVRLVCQRGERPPLPSNTPTFLRTLINKCWNNDPQKRPEMEEVYQLFATHTVEFSGTDSQKIDEIVQLIENSNKATIEKPKMPEYNTQEFKEYARNLEPNQVDQFFDDIEPDLENPHVLRAVRNLILNPVFCSSFVEKGLHKKVSNIFCPFSLRILEILVKNEPDSIGEEFIPMINRASEENPKFVISLMNSYGRKFYSIENPWCILDAFLLNWKMFLSYTAPFVSFFYRMINKYKEFKKARLGKCSRVFKKIIAHAHNPSACYNFFYEYPANIDYYWISQHISRPILTDPVILYLTTIEKFECNDKEEIEIIVRNLINYSKVNKIANRILRIIAESVYGNRVIREDLSFIELALPTYEYTMKLVEVLVRNSKKKRIFSECKYLVTLLNQIVEDFPSMVTRFLLEFNFEETFLNNLDETNFFKRYAMKEVDFKVMTKFAQLKYLKIFPKVIKIAEPSDETIEFLVAVSEYPQCEYYIQKLDFSSIDKAYSKEIKLIKQNIAKQKDS